jgi:hypothetical protein
MGFWYGRKLNDHNRFLSHEINKQVFYKIYVAIINISVIAWLVMVFYDSPVRRYLAKKDNDLALTVKYNSALYLF